MKTIQIDRDVYDYLLSKASGQAEAISQTLRRELHLPEPQASLDIDDDLYSYLASKATTIGESATQILRRELHLDSQPEPEPAPGPGPGPAPGPAPAPGPRVVEFHIAAGTGANAWNTREQMLTARVGDTLRIINDDNAAHRLHTGGAPFPHPQTDVAPGATQDYLLQSAFDPGANPPLYDHDFGQAAAFWIKVTA